MPETIAQAEYVLPHTDRERERLSLQGSILAPLTEDLLRRAGVTIGMRVLDLACGVGEVAMVAARAVGLQGHVTAIDIDTDALTKGRESTAAQGLYHVDFRHSSIADFQAPEKYDAVIGRHILIHSPQPVEVIAKAANMLKPGGIALFQEFDLSVIHPPYPPCPLQEQTMQLFRAFFTRIGQPNTGTRMYHQFRQAGFASPQVRVAYDLGGSNPHYFEWMVESLKSILPKLKEFGMTTDEQVGIETLAERLRSEALERDACFTCPALVGAFARKDW